jgi:hypothetical protein
LARPEARRVQLLCAPSGFGVTSALRAHSRRTGGVYVALRRNSSLARFAGDLVEALAPVMPGMQMTLTAAYERVLDAQCPTAALAAWFSRHAAGKSAHIAIDDLHAAGSPEVLRFIVEVVERSPESLRWLLGSESLDELPIASWMAHGLADTPLDERILALRADEAMTLANGVAPGVPGETVYRLWETTRGNLADFIFFLRAPAEPNQTGAHADVESAIRCGFEALSRREQNVVLRTALLPDLRDTTLERLPLPHGAETLARLRAASPQFFTGDGQRYDSRFDRFLRDRLAGWSDARRSAVVARSAVVLEATGDVAGALDLFVSIRRQHEILRLVEYYAFRPTQSAAAAALHDALAVLDSETLSANAAALTLRALSTALHGKSDVSETLFQHALACSRTPAQAARIRYLYGLELLRRGRPDAIAQLQPDETFFAAPPDVRVAAMASLGVAYALDGNLEEGNKWTERALRRVARTNDGAVRARVYQQASYVALEDGDFARATRLAKRAVAIGNAAGEYEVAASACSVLYSIASDFYDDPVEAASYLSEIATYGAKCGSIEKQLMAWIAAYEIEVERGNRTAVEAIERELGEFDVHYSARLPREGLLPAQVLQTTWSSDFRRAYRTLRTSAHLLHVSDREALRWSELAVYAAAAGEREEAAVALITALRILKGLPADAVRTLRARLYCALAFALLGRSAAPRMLLASVRRDMPSARPRIAALCEAISQLVAFRGGAGNHAELWNALDELRRFDFGGVARMLEALPARVRTPAAAGAQSA